MGEPFRPNKISVKKPLHLPAKYTILTRTESGAGSSLPRRFVRKAYRKKPKGKDAVQHETIQQRGGVPAGGAAWLCQAAALRDPAGYRHVPCHRHRGLGHWLPGVYHHLRQRPGHPVLYPHHRAEDPPVLRLQLCLSHGHRQHVRCRGL